MLNVATVFSGIGAFEQALKRLNIEYNILFACDNGERYLDLDKDEIIENYNPQKYDKFEDYIKDLSLIHI